jgi:hypothetical protein
MNNDIIILTNRPKTKVTKLAKLTTKDIRNELYTGEPILIYKCGMILSTTECRTWGYRIGKLRSVKHRNILLRISHGDIYTNERKYRYGLTDSPLCSCGEVEDLEHKFLKCKRLEPIWDTISLRSTEPGNEFKAFLGATIDSTILHIEELATAMMLINSGDINLVKWKYMQQKLRTSETLIQQEHLPEQDCGEEGGESMTSEASLDESDD